jgi:molybdate transport system substrate-binding protein
VSFVRAFSVEPRRRALVLGLVLGVVVLSGCGLGATSQRQGSGRLTILAAASLKGVLDEVRPVWEAAHPGSNLTISTDSSTALETQIEQGAAADLFLSADTSNAEKLVDKSLAAGDPVAFAANQLAIIVPATNPAGITSGADLARQGLKIVAANDGVPITAYAAQLVANLAAEPGYPSGFAAAYAANVVSKEDNVKAVVAKIELGEGDAAIVYATDARSSTRIRTIEVPAASNVRATYAGIVLRGSPNLASAREFLAWFAGPAGEAILARSGFLPPP